MEENASPVTITYDEIAATFTEQDAAVIGSNPNGIIDIALSDNPKAVYWLRKKFGGTGKASLLALALEKTVPPCTPEQPTQCKFSDSITYQRPGSPITFEAYILSTRTKDTISSITPCFFTYGEGEDRGCGVVGGNAGSVVITSYAISKVEEIVGAGAYADGRDRTIHAVIAMMNDPDRRIDCDIDVSDESLQAVIINTREITLSCVRIQEKRYLCYDIYETPAGTYDADEPDTQPEQQSLTITIDTMDQKLKEAIRRITKRHGLRDKYENLVKSTRSNFDGYIQVVEPIYAISRLHQYITNEKDRPRFIEADKEWVEHVINEDKCSPAAEYVNRYTKPVVIQAIHYLMDNHLWDSPLGIEGLKKKGPENYKGLESINEAVEYLKSEGIIVTEATVPDDSPSAKPAIEFIDEDPATGFHTTARNVMTQCSDSLRFLTDKFAELNKYFDNDELTELLEKENTKYIKENENLKESIKTLAAQLKAANKEAETQRQAAYDATKERNMHIDNFNKLKAQYDLMIEDYDELKREAQKAKSVPMVKVIALSKLNDLPLIGKSVLKSLIPFLRSHNIIIDENK